MTTALRHVGVEIHEAQTALRIMLSDHDEAEVERALENLKRAETMLQEVKHALRERL